MDDPKNNQLMAICTVITVILTFITVAYVIIDHLPQKSFTSPTQSNSTLQNNTDTLTNTGILTKIGILTSIVHGTVYEWNSFKPLNNAIIEVNSTPPQSVVAKDANYSFNLTPGTYLITANYFERNALVYCTQENIVVPNQGEYVHDLFLFPPYEETLLNETSNTQNVLIHGTIYEWNSFKPLNNAIIEVNSTPPQSVVAKDANYSFNLTPGTYLITAQYLEGRTLVYEARETVVISNQGEYVHDLFLFPPYEE